MAETKKYGEVQANDADYGDGRVVIEARTWWNGKEWDWAVPAWEECGLGELEGTFPSRDEANAAIAKCAEFLPMYGFNVAAALTQPGTAQ